MFTIRISTYCNFREFYPALQCLETWFRLYPSINTPLSTEQGTAALIFTLKMTASTIWWNVLRRKWTWSIDHCTDTAILNGVSFRCHICGISGKRIGEQLFSAADLEGNYVVVQLKMGINDYPATFTSSCWSELIVLFLCNRCAFLSFWLSLSVCPSLFAICCVC